MALITCSVCGKQVSDKAPKCPHCGTPVSVERTPEGEPAQTAPAVQVPQTVQTRQTVYAEPAVQPERASSYPAAAPITEAASRKTRIANAYLLCAMIASAVMYVFAFVKYMKLWSEVNDHYILSLVFITQETIEISGQVRYVKWFVILALALTVIAFVIDLVRIAIVGKRTVRAGLFALPAINIFGFWIPTGLLSNLPSSEDWKAQMLLEFIAERTFGTYALICSGVITVLFIVSIIVAVRMPSENGRKKRS